MQILVCFRVEIHKRGITKIEQHFVLGYQLGQ